MEVLGRIWDLSDVDKDGFLDRDEFAVVCGHPWLCVMTFGILIVLELMVEVLCMCGHFRPVYFYAFGVKCTL